MNNCAIKILDDGILRTIARERSRPVSPSLEAPRPFIPPQEGVQNEVHDVLRGLIGLTERVSGWLARFTGMEARFTALESRACIIEERIDHVAARLARLEEQNARMLLLQRIAAKIGVDQRTWRMRAFATLLREKVALIDQQNASIKLP